MPRRNWKTYRPGSLNDAIEACVEYARERHQMSVDRIADEIGVVKWTLYKWLEGGNIPARLIRPFENACRCTYVSQHLAAGARKLVIDLPTGRVPDPGDIALLQAACTDAVQALIGFAAGQRDSEDTLSTLTRALERLAFERAQVQRAHQPELDL